MFFETVWPAVIIWFIIAVIAIVVESNTAQMVSVWFAVSAIIACIIAAFGAALWVQLTVFSIGSVGLFFLSRPYAKKINALHTTIEGTAEGLTDEVVVITKAFSNGSVGEAKARYDVYSVIAEDNSSFEVGEKVRVKSILGNKLIVEKLIDVK